jgi:hypothetical protein
MVWNWKAGEHVDSNSSGMTLLWSKSLAHGWDQHGGIKKFRSAHTLTSIGSTMTPPFMRSISELKGSPLTSLMETDRRCISFLLSSKGLWWWTNKWQSSKIPS